MEQQIARGLSKRWLFDSYTKLLEGVGAFHGLHDALEAALEAVLHDAGQNLRICLADDECEQLAKRYEEIFRANDRILPTASTVDLFDVARLIGQTYHSEVSTEYRTVNDVSDGNAMGMIFQQMVFGNRDDDSSSIVCFSRDPTNGMKTSVWRTCLARTR